MSQTETQQALSPETVEVGDGVTYGVGSDRYAATVCEVSKSGKTVKFTNDKSTALPGHGMYDANQEYTYETVEPYEVEQYGMTQTNVRTARWNAKKEAFVVGGRVLFAGRHAHYDPSF